MGRNPRLTGGDLQDIFMAFAFDAGAAVYF